MKNKMKIIIITMVAIVAVMIVCLVTGIIKIPGLFISNDDENDLSKIKKVMETTRPTEVFILGKDIKFSEDISVQTIDKFSEEEITYAEELINTNGYYVIYLGEKYATTWDDTQNAIADVSGNLCFSYYSWYGENTRNIGAWREGNQEELTKYPYMLGDIMLYSIEEYLMSGEG